METGTEFARPPVSRSWALWTAYAAAVWAVIFAGLSFFWAVGGRTGMQPLEGATGAAAGLFVIANIIAGLVKLGAAALVVAYAWRVALPVSRRIVAALIWAGGVGMLLYGGAGLVSDVFHVSGVIHDPATVKWFFYYLVLWDPWWALGGALFTTTAWLIHRQARPPAAARLRTRRPPAGV